MIQESAGSLNQNSSEFFGLLLSMAIFITIEEEVSTRNTSEKETLHWLQLTSVLFDHKRNLACDLLRPSPLFQKCILII